MWSFEGIDVGGVKMNATYINSHFENHGGSRILFLPIILGIFSVYSDPILKYCI